MPVKVYLREGQRVRGRGPGLTWAGLLAHLLQVLGPVGRLRHGHEAAVGQDGAHDEEAEQGAEVQEQQQHSGVAMATAGGGATRTTLPQAFSSSS